MSEKTRKFVAVLGEDPETLERFKQDPKAVMDEYGVPEEHQKHFLSGDKDALRREAGVDDAAVQLLIV
ncbi:hypothetical protein G4Y73_09205 [Wenzhouxiangella sp. XN201]|uniref:hypothetical protein n=1 Tax=Wenzhouxiangella sp. XN201 TaxID=2710755 RepID=UPI0013C57D92|nr:hypothetical protein [Wenzhouxiangella sp. XN201]NEZ04320.1 hypothetical protein [Wenzhouxiangella sp. XN201]